MNPLKGSKLNQAIHKARGGCRPQGLFQGPCCPIDPTDTGRLSRICNYCGEEADLPQPYRTRVEDYHTGEVEWLPTCKECAEDKAKA